jgi:hypothetical protein
MCKKYTSPDCPACHEPVPQGGRNRYTSWAGNLLLVFVPKCSFCVLAYTSTALLCTREETLVATQEHSSPLTLYITLGLFVLILAGVLMNWRGMRSRYALAIVLAGMSMMLYSVVKAGGESLYYAGNVLVFIGIWVNGSFYYAWQKFKRAMRPLTRAGMMETT